MKNNEDWSLARCYPLTRLDSETKPKILTQDSQKPNPCGANGKKTEIFEKKKEKGEAARWRFC